MNHPPLAPAGEKVVVNGARGPTQPTPIDAIPPQTLNGKPEIVKSSDQQTTKPASAAAPVTDANSVSKSQNKDTALPTLDSPGPKNTIKAAGTKPADLSLTLSEDTVTPSVPSTGGFKPLLLTSPTETFDSAARKLLDTNPGMDIKVASTQKTPEICESKPSQETMGASLGGTKNGTSPVTNSQAADGKNDRSNVPQTNSRSPDVKSEPTSPKSPASAKPQTKPSSGSSGSEPKKDPYYEDSDSEDDELQSLIVAKRNQIRADIAAYQKSKELELAVYEKRLRDELMRKKRRKQAMANGYPMPSGSPRSFYSLNTKQAIGNLPGYLPLTQAPGSSTPAKPSGLRKVIDTKPSENESKSSETKDVEQAKKASPQTESTKPSVDTKTTESKPEIKVKSPVESAPASEKSQISNESSPISISNLKTPTSPNSQPTTRLSYSALKALDSPEKQVTPLPSSLKSTSSWASGGGKDSRRGSTVDIKPKKNKRVVFVLHEEGDWIRVKPDGEEVPMSEEEREQLRALSFDDDADDEEAELEFDDYGVPSSQQIEQVYPPTGDNDAAAGFQPTENPEGAEQTTLVNKDAKGPEDPNWISTKPAVEQQTSNTNVSSARSTISDDSLDDDVFDLDEEVPISYSSNTQPEFTTGSFEDSIRDLGLPLAPPPPPPPSGSSMPMPAGFGLRKSNSGTFADTMAYIQAYQAANLSRGSSATGSYLSSSFPRNSYGSFGTWGDAPPRPSSSHGSTTAPVAISPGRRASGSWDLVTAPTLEISKQLSSSVSGEPGKTGPELSGSVPIGSGFRRRSVSKYDIPDADETSTKDNSSAASSVNDKSGISQPPVAQTDARPRSISSPAELAQATTTPSFATRIPSENGPIGSPYGTSAPISIPPRSTISLPEERLDTAEQAKDSVSKEVVSGRPSPTSNTADKSNNTASTAKAREENEKKSVVSPTPVERVLEATTEALNKNSLPSSLNTRAKKESHRSSRSGSTTPKSGSYTKKSPSSRPKKAEAALVKPEPWHGTVVQGFPSHLSKEALIKDILATDNGQAVASPSWNSYHSTSSLSSSLPKHATGYNSSSFVSNPITSLPGVKSYSPTNPNLSNSQSPRRGPIIAAAGPRYVSSVAEEAAKAVEAEGLASVSIVGGVDGRSGLDAAAPRNSLIYTDIGPGSLKESLGNINPGSLSFSMRMALEEEEAAEAAKPKPKPT